ncbi:MAG: ATP-binding protein [Leptolyngbya sp. SIOISBB]|nr:ATP-binding protein [Leptolyngbya sp. SIOISBB]
MSEELLTQIYNAFDPKRPLEPDDPFYVKCHEVRGDENIINEVGRKIVRAESLTYQLYTGHRGVGKSTELRRLRRYLEEQGRKVIYFEATDHLDNVNVQYTDILLSCTRHLIKELQDNGDTGALRQWMKSRWQSLKDLALTEITFDNEGTLDLFGMLSATLRTESNTRQQVRAQINNHSKSLINALNEFIADAQKNLQAEELVIIADNLDRIIPTKVDEDGKTNHDEIFIDYSSQMCQLACNVIYTVPISLVYSNRVSQLREIYGDTHVLPMVMVRLQNGTIHPPGLVKLKQSILQRVSQYTEQPLVPDIFESEAVLDNLCLISGGQIRELMQLVQTALNWTDELPIRRLALLRAISQGQSEYGGAVDEEDWERLAEVSITKRVPNDDRYRGLLFNRCVLEYRTALTETAAGLQPSTKWHDVHPLIKSTERFDQALKQYQAQLGNRPNQESGARP